MFRSIKYFLYSHYLELAASGRGGFNASSKSSDDVDKFHTQFVLVKVLKKRGLNFP